ncbi:MAG: response regulator [Acidobacteria bacterium]|nr:response regulator [Acidobacteriota bacterium]
MKLQFVDETPSASLVQDLVDRHDSVEANSPESMKMLSDGIEAAQKGERAKARHLLLKVTEIDSASETAWLWLASISEYPEELLIFLNNVLEINPQNERALKWASETKTLLAKTFVQRGIDAENDGKREFAKQCFLQAIVHDSKSELAWMWLASVADSDLEKISHLRKVININPDNEKASGSLSRAQARVSKQLITTAKSAFYDGDRVGAEQLVDECLNNDPKFEEALLLKAELAETVDERIEYLEKVIAINPENQSALTLIDTAKHDRVHSLLSSARSLIDAQQNEEAAELLDEILADSPDVAEAWMLRSELADSQEEKLELIGRVLEIDPEHEFAANEFESLKLEKAAGLVNEAAKASGAGEDEKALDLLDEALENAPDHEDALLAKCQLVNSADEKTAILNLVLSKNPENESALQQLQELEDLALTMILADARASFENGELELANEGLLNAERISPENEDVLLLGYDLSTSPDIRRSKLERILQINPENKKAIEGLSKMDLEIADGYFAKASAAAASGNRSEADKLLTRTFEIAPDHENAWMLKALLCDSFEAKIGCFERVLVINPENAAAKANLQSLELILENSKMAPVESAEEIADESNEAESYDFNAKADPGSGEVDFEEVSAPSEITVEYENGEFAAEAVNYDDDNDIRVADAAVTVEATEEASFEHVTDEFENSDEFEFYEEEESPEEPVAMPQSIEDLLRERNASNIDPQSADMEMAGTETAYSDHGSSEDIDEIGSGLKTVLIVDDSPTILKLISGKLEKSGYETICAIDGMDAIKQLEEFTPDMIILDINMPNMDGYQVCRVIRENVQTENTPVIMVSGKDGFFDEELGEMAGATDYISKPFGPETLMKIVNEYLSE